MTPNTQLEFDTEPMRKSFEAQLRRAQLGVRVAVLILGLSCLALLLMHPNVEGWEKQRNINLSVLLILSILMLGMDRLNMAPIRNAVRNCDHDLKFRLTEEGVQIPFFMTTNPAVRRLVKAGKPYLDFSWTQIARWCVYPQVGKARPQYLVEMKDSEAEFGQRFGILRDLTGDHDKEIVAFCQQHLEGRFENRDKPLSHKSS